MWFSWQMTFLSKEIMCHIRYQHTLYLHADASEKTCFGIKHCVSIVLLGIYKLHCTMSFVLNTLLCHSDLHFCDNNNSIQNLTAYCRWILYIKSCAFPFQVKYNTICYSTITHASTLPSAWAVLSWQKRYTWKRKEVCWCTCTYMYVVI